MVILLCSGVAGPLQATEFAYGVGFMDQHSDNIQRVSTNEQSDTIDSLRAGFTYQERTADLIAQVQAEATYNNYLKNTFEDETLFGLESSAVWAISPQRFFWIVQDDYRQGLLNTSVPYTPANQTNVNVFITGPDFNLRLTPVHTLMFGARVGDVYTGEADADHKRFSGTAAWSYQSSQVTALSLNYEILDVKFDDTTVNNNYTSQDFYFRAESRPSRSRYLLDLGTTYINRDRGDDLRGPLTRLTWIRQLTSQSTFGVTAGKQFSNTAADVLAAATAANLTAGLSVPSAISDVLVTGDVYDTKGGLVFYNLRGSQFGIQFQAGRHKLDYVSTPEDRKETGGSLQIDYFMSALTSITLFTDYTRTEYLDFFRNDTDEDYALRFNYSLTRTVSLGLEGRRISRQSTDPTSEYVDNRAFVTLLYSSGPLYRPTFYWR
jgi:hypothetical protein